MRTMIQNGVYLLLCLSFLFNMTSCKDDDPDYSRVDPPVVPITHGISGIIKTMGGEVIKDATITLTSGSTVLTQKTDATGSFSFEGLQSGDYTIKAEIAGRLSESEKISFTDQSVAQRTMWTPMMIKSGVEELVKAAEGKVVTTETETITQEENAKITIVSTVPANAIESDATLIFTPIYSIADAQKTRAVENEVMAMGIKVSCSNANLQLKKEIAMVFNLSTNAIKVAKIRKYENGQWIDISSQFVDNKITFEANAFTSYALFLPSVTKSSTSGTIPVTFEKAEYDNLYGAADMLVQNVAYTYKSGSQITSTSQTPLAIFLTELLAREIKGKAVSDVKGSHPMNLTLPVGTKMVVKGTQQVTTQTLTSNGISASGKEYGGVKVVFETGNRQHSGGSN